MTKKEFLKDVTVLIHDYIYKDEVKTLSIENLVKSGEVSLKDITDHIEEVFTSSFDFIDRKTPNLQLVEEVKEIENHYSVMVHENDMKALLRIRDYFAGEDKSQLKGLAFDILDRNFGTFEYNF